MVRPHGSYGLSRAFVILNIAIKRIGASRAAPFSSIQPVFAFVLGTTLLGERPDVLVVVGTPIVVGGLALVITSRPSSDTGERPVTQINVVLNWFEELKRLVPTDN